ncbi:LysR family transcriptional regulator [Thalassotalea atypica]|uniref:LysR family transcriptional regulator n=1 Tax=Thalassotalea atypica TaxID=2054316 RepID=UPI00257441CB|nr:LysR family transcriptional regulator [Thalassotalea atypica]
MIKEHKKLERLFLFSEVANCLSFTEAAANLAMSKGYLSAQIKQLEADLKTPLLVRTTRTVRLTRAGHQVVKDFKQVHTSMLAIERNLASEQQAIEGLIRLTAPKQFAESLLVNLCFEFSQLYPDIKFEIDSSYTQYDLTENDFDLAFRATRTPPENMIAKRLFEYGYLCCAAPSYIEKYGELTSVEQLNEHRCLTSVNEHYWTLNDENIEVTSTIAINDNFVLRDQAITGAGIVRLPEYFVRKAIQNKQLVPLFNLQKVKGQGIYLLQPQLIYPPKKIIKFIKFIQKNLK